MPAPGAALVMLIPRDELAPGGAATIRTQVVEAILNQAANELRIPKERLVARDIDPDTDLDYGSSQWRELTSATVGAYETMSTGTMADQRYVALYGVKDSSPVRCVSLLRLDIGGAYRAIWNLQNLDDDGIGFSPSAVVIPPNAPFTISRYVIVGNVAAEILLKGVVIEPRGKTVSP